jgi:hypothetical protein
MPFLASRVAQGNRGRAEPLWGGFDAGARGADILPTRLRPNRLSIDHGPALDERNAASCLHRFISEEDASDPCLVGQ